MGITVEQIEQEKNIPKHNIRVGEFTLNLEERISVGRETIECNLTDNLSIALVKGNRGWMVMEMKNFKRNKPTIDLGLSGGAIVVNSKSQGLIVLEIFCNIYYNYYMA